MTAPAGLRSRITGRLTDAGYAAGWRAVRMLPEPLARSGFEAGGRWAAGRDGAGVRQLRANLRVATGGTLSEAELDELHRRAMASYARYWQEAFRLPTLGIDRIRRDTRVPGFEHVERARAEGRGVVLALPHSGNWDAAGAWLADRLGTPFLTIAERLKPESLYRRFLEYREGLGMKVTPLTGGPRPGSEVLRQWLAEGGVSCLLVDRNFGTGGVSVEFFGRPALLPSGAALLAARTGAALLPAVPRFDGAGWHVQVHPEVPVTGEGRLATRVTDAMQAVADVFTEGLGRHPEDWHMLGRIWADVPPDPPRRAVPAGEEG
ncbi:phosphatidylinositol mannoside acyltransferase [Blastococcus sp. TML/M2B]|uniref:phosphatidylinositol mannoside acyltransferase n=1 Tax=unclassified Blastococcus TaxID=2619396 RepID=UPI001909F7DD|nr:MULTISPECIES: phosphatidylinositol mannoside acyltransferase [unclassified Blastococcus]MBN1092496.1 phosphatidylinositol mannoside acyltransferase [Blastococcus sp. TML/M2B]MBN1097411.1 phosphatidylinositol mannoside acyltransferase [Blastococcus sp. TML/C7B]